MPKLYETERFAWTKIGVTRLHTGGKRLIPGERDGARRQDNS
jgi:hypothetical protein